MKKIILICIVLICTSLIAGTVIDSLKTKLHNVPEAERVSIYRQLAEMYGVASIDEATLYAQKAMETAKKIENDVLIKQAVLTTAQIFFEAANYDDTIELLVPITNQINDTELTTETIEIIDLLTRAYEKSANYVQAITASMQLMNLAQKSDNQEVQALSRLRTGSLYLLSSQLDMANEFLAKSYYDYNALADEDGVSKVLREQAKLYIYEKKYQLAGDTLLEAFKIQKKLDNRVALTEILSAIANLHHQAKNYELMKKYYQQALELSREQASKERIAINLSGLGKAYELLGNFGRALEHEKEALNISKELGNTKLIEQNYAVLSETYARLGDYKKAYQFGQRSFAIHDSLFDAELSTELAKMSNKYEAILRNEKIESLTESQAIQTKTIKSEKNKNKKLKSEIIRSSEKIILLKQLQLMKETQSQNFKKFVWIGIVATMLLILLLYSRYRIKVKSQKQIERKNEELKVAYTQLEGLANTDTLTSLANRRSILIKLKGEEKRYKRYGAKFCLILCDIDHFKNFNDNYGHDCGDFVLFSVANFFKNKVRNLDTVSRWGGEEFLILLPDTDLNGAKVLGEKLRTGIAESVFFYKGNRHSISLTFGISIFEKPMDIDKCIVAADIALYKGKEKGRNQVVIAPSNMD